MIHRELFAAQTKSVLQRAAMLAWELGHEFIGSEHILWGICGEERSVAATALRGEGLDAPLIRELIERYNGVGKSAVRDQSLAQDANRVIELAEAQSKKLMHKKTSPEHILLGMLQEKTCVAAKIIISTGASVDEIIGSLLEQLNTAWPASEESSATDPKKPQETKTLDQYSRDLTEAAKNGALDPVIGRDKEIQRVVQILSRRRKNNPVLIGEPGVGKTAVAEGLAQRVAEGRIPENLMNSRIVMLDITKMLSGAKFRGDFEERLKLSVEDAVKAGNVILFIDELHTLIGAGAAEGAIDAANILKPSLSRGEVQVIGATTLNEYRKHVEKDAALERRFQPVTIGEPSKEIAVEILLGLRDKYEAHHKLKITDEAVNAAVIMSARYIQDRYLPDKAIDLVDEAASRVRTGNLTIPESLLDLENKIAILTAEKEKAVKEQLYEKAAGIRDQQSGLKKQLVAEKADWIKQRAGVVTAQDIAAVVCAWTGIPVTMLTQDESERLLKLEDTLHKRVIGQDDAVTAVSKAIRRGRVGLKDPNRPIGSFLFLGPTGVGKTELCKALAEAMFQDENAMLRVDMSEYMEKHTVSKLIGSPPGYVGYDEGGQLTEKVRRKPYSVILFDEIEKAHGDVWSILLQIMEDGRLTDAQGRTVDFKNTIIVMTSNLGARNITDKRSKLGFLSGDAAETKPVEIIREKVMEELKNTFKPEFLNRLDDTIVFHQLDRGHIREIACNMLKNLNKRVAELGIALELDDGAIEALVGAGFDPIYGARPLRRVIQSSIEDKAAEKILEGGLKAGDKLLFTCLDGKIEAQAIVKPAEKELEPVAQ